MYVAWYTHANADTNTAYTSCRGLPELKKMDTDTSSSLRVASTSSEAYAWAPTTSYRNPRRSVTFFSVRRWRLRVSSTRMRIGMPAVYTVIRQALHTAYNAHSSVPHAWRVSASRYSVPSMSTHRNTRSSNTLMGA